jgi:hypothetical protein
MINVPKLTNTFAALNTSGLRVDTKQPSMPRQVNVVDPKRQALNEAIKKYHDDPFFVDASPANVLRHEIRELPKTGFARPQASGFNFMYSPGPLTRQRSTMKIDTGNFKEQEPADIPISPLNNRNISPLMRNEISPFRRGIARQPSNLMD